MDCIRSLDSQSLDHGQFEVLFIINGPCDPYVSLLKGMLSETGLDAKVLYTPVAGVSHARNMGIDQARGSFITFVDDDDTVSEGYLESLLKVSSSDTVGVSCFFAFSDDPASRDDTFFLTRKMRHPDAYLSLPFYRSRSVLSVSVGKLFHRDIIRSRRFDERFDLGEDSLFVTTITDRFHLMRYGGSECVYKVRLRKDSVTHRGYSIGFVLGVAFRLFSAYAHVYMSNPKEYSLRLFLLRIPGIMRNSVLLLIGR